MAAKNSPVKKCLGRNGSFRRACSCGSSPSGNTAKLFIVSISAIAEARPRRNSVRLLMKAWPSTCESVVDGNREDSA